MQNTGTPFRVLDTFAGAGGFSLGFQLAGFQVIGAIESDKWASETFVYNHPEATVITRDIMQVSEDDIIAHFGTTPPEIIIGGPPCQGFSIANRKAGDPKDPRNSLFSEFLRFGKVLKPKVMVMENVPNLLNARTSSGEKVIEIIQSSLEELGFYTYIKVLQATDYGVPQIRQRLFVIASIEPLIDPFPKPTHIISPNEPYSLFGDNLKLCPTLWDAISDLPYLNAAEGAEDLPYILAPQNIYQEEMRRDSHQLFNHKAMNHTPRMIERFASMSWGHSVNDVPDHLKPRRRNSDNIVIDAYDQNNRRMFPDKPCHTLPASFYANFVHPYQHRNFTAREGARIQSFPDWYRFMGKPTVVSSKLLSREGRVEENYLCQYNQIGNAVPPILSKAIASNLLEQLEGVLNVRTR